MTNYLIRRFFQMIVVVIVSSMAIYFLLWLAPGGPLDGINQGIASRRSRFSEQDIQRLAEYLGLHRGPLWGFVAWIAGEDWMNNVPQALWPRDQMTGEPISLQRPICRENPVKCGRGVIRMDLGISWQVARGSPVIKVIGDRLQNTLILMVSATLFSLLVAIPVGIYSAVHQYSRMDYVFTTFTFFGTAMPVFWFALLVIIAVSGNQSPLYQMFKLPYFPTGNVTSAKTLPGSLHDVLNIKLGSWADILIHAILPTIVLSLLYMAGWGRFMRSSMLEVLRQDYVRTARAKGLVERVVIMKHALRNSLIPLITIVVFQLPGIFGGAIITETVFNWKGMGFLYFQALGTNDYPVAMALLFITSILVVVATLLGDFLYTVVDPRIRFS
jgi:peptide/nickel transport system permease protein